MHKKGFLTPPPRRKELSDTPVKLCNDVSRIFRARMRERRDEPGVMSQPGARLILSFLAIGDGTTQLELVKATLLKPPSVSLILKKMEEEGIVRRETDPEDMRAVRVYLTDLGRALDAANIALIKEIDEEALKGITSEEKARLMALLSKIKDNLLRNGEDENGKNS